MTVLTANELLSCIANLDIGGWWRRRCQGVTASSTAPSEFDPPASGRVLGWMSLTGPEQDRLMDFAHGIGTLADVHELLNRLDLRMSQEFLTGHRQTIEGWKRDGERYRAGLRERAREAREAKCTRLPSSS